MLPLPFLLRRLVPPAAGLQTAPLRLPFFASLVGWEQAAPATTDRRVRAVVANLAWIALLLAATRPQWVGEPLTLPITGRDIVLAIDLSGSMQERDQVLDGQIVDRLLAVKSVAGDFIERRIGDRIGVILFGTKPYVQVPLTFDRVIARRLLQEASIGLAGGQTAIGDAIALSVQQLRERPASSRVIVLLTDGENTAGHLLPDEAARLAAFHDMRVHTIGLVSAASRGSQVQSELEELDERTLQSVARATGGTYFRARDTSGLEAVYKLLDEMEPAADQTDLVRPTAELFYWPLGFAYAFVAALVLAALTGDWWKKFIRPAKSTEPAYPAEPETEHG